MLFPLPKLCLVFLGFDPGVHLPGNHMPCGPAALYVCTRLVGLNPPFEEVRRACLSTDGMSVSMHEPAQAAKDMKFPEAICVEISLDNLVKSQSLAILRCSTSGSDRGHYVVIAGYSPTHLLVINPSRNGEVEHWVHIADFLKNSGWAGHAILLDPPRQASSSAAAHLMWGGACGLLVGLVLPCFISRRQRHSSNARAFRCPRLHLHGTRGENCRPDRWADG